MAADAQQQAVKQTHTAPSEWRWVIRMSIGLIGILALPYLVAFYFDAQDPLRQFMGFLVNPLDGATYLSKIQLGREGELRTIFRHSPDPTQGAYLTVLYTGLGYLGRFLGMSNMALFHTARLITGFLMLLALYQLAANIWRRQRARRNFYLLVLFGSGFGWLYAPLSGNIDSPDLSIPESFPLYSLMSNVHFPLAIALLALSVGSIIVAFSPGFNEEPSLQNGGLQLLLCSMILALIAPHALVPLAMAVGGVIVIGAIRQRYLPLMQFRWLMMIVLPAAPMAFYYFAELRFNPAVAAWSLQNVTRSPSLWVMLLGFGLPLIVALPGIWRAIRRFEPDGDQLMLLWALSMLLVAYTPIDAQRRFVMGIMIPIAYFAVRALDEFWFRNVFINKKRTIWIGLLGFSLLSYGLLFALQLVGASSTQSNDLYLDVDYVRVFDWLQATGERDQVILTSEKVGLWLPGESSQRVLYGHPFETINADANASAVQAWYKASADDSICTELLALFEVRYVLWGNVERTYADESPCLAQLTEVERFGNVVIFATN